MSRDALKIELYSLLSKNGFAFTSQGVDSFANRLEQDGFVQDGSGTWWSPSSEPLIDAIYRAWGDSASTPAPKPPQDAPKPDQYFGYERADWESLRPELKYGAADSATGPATPSWQKAVPVVTDQQCAAHAGLTLADFKALGVERRLEIEATVKGAMMKGAR